MKKLISLFGVVSLIGTNAVVVSANSNISKIINSVSNSHQDLASIPVWKETTTFSIHKTYDTIWHNKYYVDFYSDKLDNRHSDLTQKGVDYIKVRMLEGVLKDIKKDVPNITPKDFSLHNFDDDYPLGLPASSADSWFGFVTYVRFFSDNILVVANPDSTKIIGSRVIKCHFTARITIFMS